MGPFLQGKKTLLHRPVSGPHGTNDRAILGSLAPSFRPLFGDFFSRLPLLVKGEGYGRARQARFIGEPGAVGDYRFSGFRVPLVPCPPSLAWVWSVGRQLFEETGHPLGENLRLVAFIPFYSEGGSCGCHRDDEPEMRDEWIVSVSFGASASFQFSSSRQGPFQRVLL